MKKRERIRVTEINKWCFSIVSNGNSKEKRKLTRSPQTFAAEQSVAVTVPVSVSVSPLIVRLPHHPLTFFWQFDTFGLKFSKLNTES